MTSLMDEYPMPGMDVDPRELERMKYLALIRMGAGMMSKEKPGSAVQGGINTYIAGEESARRNADQKMQEMRARMTYAMGMKKAEAERAAQEKKMALVENLANNKAAMDRYGITKEIVDYTRATGDLGPITKLLEPYTSKPSDMRMIGNVPHVTRANEQGEVGVMDQGVEVGRVVQPGYLENLRARVGVEAAAKATNTPTQLGVDESGRPQYGYPPPPPDQKQFNISGPPSAQNAARADYLNPKRWAPGTEPLPPGVISRGPDPEAVQRKKVMSEAYIEQVKKDFPIAFNASKIAIPMAHNALGALDSGQVMTGKGADIKRELGGWLATFGYQEADDPVANTQAFIANMARETTALLQSGAFGAGTGIGQKDLDFAKDMSGSNPTLTEGAIRKIIALNLKAHRAKIDIHNEQVSRYSDAFGMPEFKSLYTVPVPDEYKPSSKPRPAATGATAAPSTQRAIELNQLNQREKEIEERLRRARGQ